MLVDKTKTAKTSATQNEHIKCCNTHPFRYKGYYFDSESGMYYCHTRYYVPEWCRWLNADHPSFLQPESLQGMNLFAYCGNNPVMCLDKYGYMPQWLETTLKIAGGIAIIDGAIALSLATFGVTSVIFAGAAIGAIAGGIGAAVGTISTGGSIHDFANNFLVSTATGALSGAVAASPIGLQGQIAINIGIGMLNYLGTQGLSGEEITLGGLLYSGFIGGICGFIGGNGWMKSFSATSFINLTGSRAIMNAVSIAGVKSLLKMTLPSMLLPVFGGFYDKSQSVLNRNENFVGI